MSKNKVPAAFLEKLGTVVEIEESDLATIKKAKKTARLARSDRIMFAVSACLPKFWSETRKLFAGKTQLFCQRRQGLHKTLEPSVDSQKFRHDLALFLCGISPLCSATKGDLGVIKDEQAKENLKSLVDQTKGRSCCYVKDMFRARLELQLGWKRLAEEILSLEADIDNYSDCTICEVNSAFLAIYNNVSIAHPS